MPPGERAQLLFVDPSSAVAAEGVREGHDLNLMFSVFGSVADRAVDTLDDLRVHLALHERLAQLQLALLLLLFELALRPSSPSRHRWRFA
jgi:hypothetical protein